MTTFVIMLHKNVPDPDITELLGAELQNCTQIVVAEKVPIKPILYIRKRNNVIDNVFSVWWEQQYNYV